MPRRRRGIALLDVVVSLALLGLTGVALITLMGQTSKSLRQIRDRERATRRASDELGRLVAYDRTQMAALVGRSRLDGWTLDVSQPTTDLFDVSIAPSDTDPALLRTTVYRPDTNHAAP